MKKEIVASLAVVLVLAGNAMAVVESHTHPHPGPGDLESHIVPQDILKQLDVGFVMELEGFAAKSGGVSESDIALATVELTMDAEIDDAVSGHLGLLWEEDDTEENNLDEGYITFGATEEIPFYGRAGRMYLPFGNFESAFISDPLTLEMAEINQSAALVGFGNDWVDLNAGAFNGDFEEDADKLDDAFASVAFTPVEGLVFGVYWLSDLLETDGFETFSTTLGGAYETCNAAGAYLNAQLGPVAVNAEFVTALERLDPAAGGLLPNAYNLEASMPVVEKVTAGVKFEGSDDFYGDVGADKLADWQAGVVVSCELNDHVTLSGEYLHADGLDEDESRDMVTMQIAMEL